MTLRITTLSENTAGRGDFLGEWGLSILLETESANILFDGGKSISAVHNADGRFLLQQGRQCCRHSVSATLA